MSIDYRIRRATVEDAAVIADHRAKMFLDMKRCTANDAQALRIAAEPALREMMASGEYLGWLIEIDEQIVAGGGMILRRLLPRPDILHESREAYILNVFTERAYRRRGIARILLQEMLEWCRRQNIPRVTLHASDEGAGLYRSLGFELTNEMILKK